MAQQAIEMASHIAVAGEDKGFAIGRLAALGDKLELGGDRFGGIVVAQGRILEHHAQGAIRQGPLEEI